MSRFIDFLSLDNIFWVAGNIILIKYIYREKITTNRLNIGSLMVLLLSITYKIFILLSYI